MIQKSLSNAHNYSKDETKDRQLLLFICAYLVLQALNYLVYSIGANSVIWKGIMIGLLALLSIPVWFVIIERNGLIAIAVETFFALALVYTRTFGEISSNFSSISFNLLLVYIPMGLAYLCVKNEKLALDYFYYAIFPIEITCIVSVLFFYSKGYSMSLGYYMVFALLVRYDRIVNDKKWFDIVFLAIDLLVIIAVSSRGPILCVIIYTVIVICSSKSMSLKKKVLFFIICLFLGIIIFFNSLALARGLIAILDTFGIESRTLRLILEGSINYDAGRTAVARYYISKIQRSPYIGYGIAGSWDYESYPHNIIIEMLLAFGIPLGLLFILLLLTIIVRGLKQKNDYRRRIAQIFLGSLISLLWSGSFIMSPVFFVGVASCLNVRESIIIIEKN